MTLKRFKKKKDLKVWRESCHPRIYNQGKTAFKNKDFSSQIKTENFISSKAALRKRREEREKVREVPQEEERLSSKEITQMHTGIETNEKRNMLG